MSDKGLSDVFADLVPGRKAREETGQDDSVIAITATKDPIPTGSSSFQPGAPMGARRDARSDMTSAVEEVVSKLTSGLTEALARIDRRLDSLENRTEQASQALQELQSVASLRDETIKERISSVEKSLREVHRCVQIIRDKQELASAADELRQFSTHSSVLEGESGKHAQASSPVEAGAAPGPVTVAELDRPSPAPVATPSSALAPATFQPVPRPALAAPVQVPIPPAQVVVPAPGTAVAEPHASAAFQALSPTGSVPPQPFSAAPAVYQAPVAPPSAPAPYSNVFGSGAQTAGRPQAAPGVQPQPPTYPGPGPVEAPMHLPQPQQPQPIPPPPPFAPERSHSFTSAASSNGPVLPQAPSGLAAYGSAPVSMPHLGSYGAPQPYQAAAAPLPPPPPQPPVPYGSPAPGYSGPTGAAGYPMLQQAYPRPIAAPAPTLSPAPPPRSNQPTQDGGPPSGRGVPIEKVIDDVAIMGFSREEVRRVLNSLMESGETIDLNIVLDRLGAR